MSPLDRFQVLLKPDQLEALRRIEQRTGTSVGALIRLAIDAWLESNGETKNAAPRRAQTRRKA